MSSFHSNSALSAVAGRPPPSPSPSPENPQTHHLPVPVKALLHAALVGSLSLSLLVAAPRVEAETPVVEACREEDAVVEGRERRGSVTNEGIVEEAWEVVNDSFLDAQGRGWTPEMWLQKKNDILSSRIQSRDRAHDIIRRMLSSLHDPYTRFLSSSEFSKMARYDLTGIGVNIREVPNDSGDIKLKILGLVLDGPAYSAGVRQGDEVLSVNGIDVKGMSAFEVSSLLQGPTETFVTMEVKHGNCGPLQSIAVERKFVARTPVFYRLEKVENGNISVGYIHLKEFNALARKDLVTAIRRLQDSGASYFVLDLRDNLGGLVQAGIEVAKLFLDKGDTVIYTVGRDPQILNDIVADSKPMFTSPLVVLVNNRTASASEIVAASLHDHCRAILIGDRTFGKGLIQSVFELHDGSGVVVTIGKYVTPNHVDINENGIEPDFAQVPGLSDLNNRLLQCQMKRKG